MSTTAPVAGSDDALARYVTLREGEHDVSRHALLLRPHRTGFRLRYRDEDPAGECDHHGVLYARVLECLDSDRWPAGVLKPGRVHPGRQRECISELRCQLCKRDAAESATKLGILFVDLVTAQDRAVPGWPEGAVTYQPPVCLHHAQYVSADLNPLSTPATIMAVRVRSPAWYGVLGTPYEPSHFDPDGQLRVRAGRPQGELVVPFDDPRRHLLLGSRHALALHDVTVIDLEAELAAPRPSNPFSAHRRKP